MARSRKGNKVDGVLLLDKPVGMSSNSALQKVRFMLKAQKAGHTGTLDPLASGLLPLCFGEATKFSADLLDADKEYEAEIKFGETTTTADAEGEVTSKRPVRFTEDKLLGTLKKFTGKISQVPPMYSALKRDGKRLYEIARKGETVDREPREIVISELELLGFTSPVAKVRVLCSKGTYVRVLAEDIGKDLGCGAHLLSLRRTKVGQLSVADSVPLKQVEKADVQGRLKLLAPIDSLLSTLKTVELEGEQANRFSHGQSISIAAPKKECKVKVYRLSDGSRELLGSARLDADGRLIPGRLVSSSS